jgi:hypothetical protein
MLPDFSGKLYPSQISMVGVDSLIHQPKRKDSFIKASVCDKVKLDYNLRAA